MYLITGVGLLYDMACNLLYSGDVHLKEMHEAVQDIKSKPHFKFAPFVTTGFKVGLSPQPMAVLPHWSILRIPLVADSKQHDESTEIVLLGKQYFGIS